MNLDFAALLVVLTFLSGLVWAIDAVVLAPRRRAAAAALGPDADADTRAQTLRHSVPVDYARSFFPIFLVVLVLRSFIVEPFKIPSGSMMPTLLVNDFILVNKYDYGLRLPVLNTLFLEVGTPARGDVVVFRYPEDPSVPFIKRVVGLPGDRVLYRNRHLYINGERVETEIIGPYRPPEGQPGAGSVSDTLELQEFLQPVEHDILINPGRPSRNVEMQVPEGHYFVLGDNRDNSKDSRFWGTVPDENLIGRAFVIWMNFGWNPLHVDWSRFGLWID